MTQYTLGNPNLVTFAETLMDLGKQDRQITAVTSDSRGSGKLIPFGEQLPDQIVETGIAEQNLVGMAAGLAASGKKVFAVSPACFLTARSLEQIKNDVCYSDNPVNLVGISAGVSYGALGSTHHAIHDFAVLRAIDNITIVVPADKFETAAAIRQAAELESPVYLRFGKRAIENVHIKSDTFKIGHAIQLKKGSDIALIATGETVIQACLAADALHEKGINARVISMHTIKPLDQESVLKAAGECQAMMTIEEHSIAGGLGEACASLILQADRHLPFKILGIPDEYTVTGSQMEIFTHYGLTAPGIAQTALELLKKA